MRNDWPNYVPCDSSHDVLIHAWTCDTHIAQVIDRGSLLFKPLVISACGERVEGRRLPRETALTCIGCLGVVSDIDPL